MVIVIFLCYLTACVWISDVCFILENISRIWAEILSLVTFWLKTQRVEWILSLIFELSNYHFWRVLSRNLWIKRNSFFLELLIQWKLCSGTVIVPSRPCFFFSEDRDIVTWNRHSWSRPQNGAQKSRSSFLNATFTVRGI
jgi:hypothetical protein